MEDHIFINNLIQRMRKQLKMSFNQTNISHINTRKLSYDSFSESIYDKFSGISLIGMAFSPRGHLSYYRVLLL